MVVCGAVGAAYLLLMLGLLLWFLRRYKWGRLGAGSPGSVEMRPVRPSYPYAAVMSHASVESAPRGPPSCATLSHKSIASRQSSHIYYKPQPPPRPTYIRAIPDITKMERLATL